ncbi:Cytochrome b561 [Sphaceloma murrayae]|uniref:Cytochrome b561 n=1 Tax=Sphaceloma murrayae TaxID=2082308 RepID=A0A2K1R049_9PEZI|nr:Cytochrome b561 [Sphaceloma murrayae]
MSYSENPPAATGTEQEPLLGRAGDATQKQEQPILYNLVLGTAVVAQGGIWVLTAIVWGAVFSSNLMLFSAHPLLNSAAVLLFVQAILLVQPTATKSQKIQGANYHAAVNDTAVLLAIAGLVVIEYNKIDHGGTHFVSAHAILGLTTYLLIALQAVVGITMYFTPGLYGGVDNAKSLYKYHRASGYLALLLLLATVCAATYTDFNKNVLGMQLWAVVVSSVLVVVGIGARMKKSKFGL